MIVTKKKQMGCLAAAALVLAGLAWFWVSHVFVGGRFYAKDASSLDVRGITPESYDALRAALPACDLLWEVPVDGKTYPLDVDTVQLEHLTEADGTLLAYLPNLREVDAMDCGDYDALLALYQTRRDLVVRYQVPLGGGKYASTETEITIPNPDPAELAAKLSYLPGLRTVNLDGALPEMTEITGLQAAFPGLDFRWAVEVGGALWPQDTQRLEPGEGTFREPELARKLSLLPELVFADLRGCQLDTEEKLALTEQFPDCFFLWEVMVCGVPVQSDAESLDLSKMTVRSPEEVENMLPLLPKLNFVDMSYCGLDSPTLDALNRRHADVKFVWTVNLGGIRVRTDETYFMPIKHQKNVTREDVYELRYCTDMEAIDVGHMYVVDCEWAAFMPKLTYLVLGETGIGDLSPLAGLKNLKFLELFTIPATDLSPLVTCTGLEDLNVSRMYKADPKPLEQMTWLKHLWWCDAYSLKTPEQKAVLDTLPAKLPDTQVKYVLNHPTAGGWRKLDNYYKMRDALEIGYFPAD